MNPTDPEDRYGHDSGQDPHAEEPTRPVPDERSGEDAPPDRKSVV
jgi:hypothetical protein